MLEHGTHYPKPQTLKKITDALRISPPGLLGKH